MKPNKACPVVLRRSSNAVELLAFKHPLAGCQLVKGSVEINESLDVACERELFEESGIVAQSGRYLGVLDVNHQGQTWGFHEMVYTQTLPNSWDHFTQDGGGLVFSFFWLPLRTTLHTTPHATLDETPDNSWHDVFKRAVHYIENNHLA